MWSKVNTLEDKPRSGWTFFLFKCVRNIVEKAESICVIILQHRKVNSGDVKPLETIWIIFDETTYKDPAQKHRTSSETVTTIRLEKCAFRQALGARTFYTSPLIKSQKT